MILAYHEFCETPVRDVYAVTRETFMLHALIASEYACAMDCMTFDDAHSSHFQIAAPVLQQLGITGIFFAPTAWIGCHDGIMTWRELRELNDAGHTIGSHTHTHPMLTTCGDRTLRNELKVSREMLEDLIGDEVSTISIPSGRVNARVLAACGEAGYRRVYTSRVGQYLPASEHSPEVIGRFVVRRTTTERTLRAFMEGRSGTCRRLRIESESKRVIKALVGDILYQRMWRFAVRSKLYGD
jgi:hypothetical protein